MPTIEKICIALTSEQLSAVRAAVDGGDYATTSEVVRDALRDWQIKRDMRRSEIERLRQLWDEGSQSGQAGAIDMTALREEARDRLAKAGKAVAGGRS
ncbi:type II toxin-antitoxin system ParD family antitoxin [Bosea sp. LjRoot9]|uniref:ribbon-helix-helix domain-containing protein n=1 Tax=Bosea sp. LjRoot9 TaxID=3342341 RepID=UPI003ECC459B